MRKNLLLLFYFLIAGIGMGLSQTITNQYYDVQPGWNNGIRFYGNNYYGITTGGSAPFKDGPITNFSMKFNMNNQANRGWTWGVYNQAPVTSLNTQGHFRTKGDVRTTGGWFRADGSKGLYFQSHGGGFYMLDNTWIRTYGNKSFYHNSGVMRTDGTFQVGSSGSRFRVSTNGNVGIGKTSPAFKLDVNGIARVSDKLYVGDRTNPSYAMVVSKSQSFALALFENKAATGGSVTLGGATGALISAHTKNKTNGRNALTIANPDGTLAVVRAGGLTLLGLRGNVGIGMSSPAYKLDVNGTINATDIKINGQSIGSGGSGNVKLGHDTRWGATGVYLANGQAPSPNDGYAIMIKNNPQEPREHGAVDIQAQSEVGAKMELKADEPHIILGRTDLRNHPNQQTIVVGKLVVNQTGDPAPDYVFEDSYHLWPLSEIESFVKENKHLPNFPKGSEYEKEMDVRKLTFKLIEKVEELTLYTIEQQKEIKALKAKLSEIESRP